MILKSTALLLVFLDIYFLIDSKYNKWRKSSKLQINTIFLIAVK